MNEPSAAPSSSDLAVAQLLPCFPFWTIEAGQGPPSRRRVSAIMDAATKVGGGTFTGCSPSSAEAAPRGSEKR